MSLLIFRYFVDCHSPFFFKKNGLAAVAQGISTRNNSYPNMEELKHKAGLRVAERITVFEIAYHFN